MLTVCWWMKWAAKNQVLHLWRNFNRFGRAFGRFGLLTGFAILYGVLLVTLCLQNWTCELGICHWRILASCVGIIKGQHCIVCGCVSMLRRCGSQISLLFRTTEKVFKLFLFFRRKCCAKGRSIMWPYSLQWCGAYGRDVTVQGWINPCGLYMKSVTEQKVW